MSMPNLSAAFDGMRREAKQWKYRALKAENALDELRMHLHQVSIGNSQVKDTALAYLKAEALEYHAKVMT